VVDDIRMSASARGHVSTHITDAESHAALARAASAAERFDRKVARFHYLAETAEDQLRKFLYYFLALEVNTHRVFQTVTDNALAHIRTSERARLARLAPSVLEHEDRPRTLRDRFVCCALVVWTWLLDTDITSFVQLKAVRDDIAHGSLDEPPPTSIPAVAQLLRSVHQPLQRIG
jgi:hypothetical protein